MLPKFPDDNHVTKLRTIVLFKPEFNHGYKHVGYLMLKNAEQHNALAPKQYESRKNKSAIDQYLNKRLTLALIC